MMAMEEGWKTNCLEQEELKKAMEELKKAMEEALRPVLAEAEESKVVGEVG